MRRYRARRSARGFFWMAAYGACVILVLSFICFEVLDIDGSDFTSPMRAAATIKVTDPPQDLRRPPLQTAIPPQPLVAVNEYGARLRVQHRVDDACADTPAHTSLRRDSRRTLARSLLADPARSA